MTPILIAYKRILRGQNPPSTRSKASSSVMTSSHETAGPVEIVDSMEAVEFDIDAGLFRAAYDCKRDRASMAIVAVVAAATNRDSLELTPLHAAIDSSALDALFSKSKAGVRRVSFSYEGFDVTVTNEGTIEATPLEAA